MGLASYGCVMGRGGLKCAATAGPLGATWQAGGCCSGKQRFLYRKSMGVGGGSADGVA